MKKTIQKTAVVLKEMVVAYGGDDYKIVLEAAKSTPQTVKKVASILGGLTLATITILYYRSKNRRK